jgi:hypothetical protein
MPKFNLSGQAPEVADTAPSVITFATAPDWWAASQKHAKLQHAKLSRRRDELMDESAALHEQIGPQLTLTQGRALVAARTWQTLQAPCGALADTAHPRGSQKSSRLPGASRAGVLLCYARMPYTSTCIDD